MKKSKKEIPNHKDSFWNKVRENEPAALHTTLGIGGPVKYTFEANKINYLLKAISECKKYNIEYYIIGGGSNILVNDEGFDGMLIINKVKSIEFFKNKYFKVTSGTPLQEFINFTIDKGFSGIEKMSGIPGTVGGAIYGNAGAYSQAISDHIVSVKAFDGSKTLIFKKEKCGFDYRKSIFKKNKFTILEAVFLLEKGEKEFLKKISLDTIQLRAQKYPPGIKTPGSFFKNVVAEKLTAKQLKNIPQEKIMYGKIPAGYLLESVGAKGALKGDAKFADNHGNLLINIGSSSSKDFLALANLYADKVENKYGIKLDPEVQLLGFKDEIK